VPAATGATGIEGSEDCFPVTPHDTNELAVIPRGLLIAVGGTLKITQENNQVRALTVPAGFISCRPRIVWSAGTSATGITAIV